MKDRPAPEAARGTADLFVDALSHLSRLVRGEVALARAEIGESVRSAGRGLALVAAAAIFGLVALGAAAAAAGLMLIEAGLDAPVAVAAVALGFALVAAVLAFAGDRRLSAPTLTRSRTVRNVRRDIQTLTETLTDGTAH